MILKAPIETTLRNDLTKGGEAFCERIRGNYLQMGSYVEEADLMHLVTQPPQVFLMNGGMTNLVENASVENTQIKKVEVINQLVNRILISADASLSYQDRVYITNILHQLGIRDERKFMKEVYRLTRQTREQNETINLYWDNLSEIRSMVEEYTQQNNLQLRKDEEIFQQEALHLHEEVNRRLQTASVYQILRNFYESRSGDRTVTNAEYRITEQGRMAREILLNRLREEVRGEAAPLVYRHENIYEGDEERIEEVTLQEVTERVTSAILLNLVDNLYENTYERLDHTQQNWISAEDTFYGAAENTLYRIEQNTAYLQYLHDEYLRNEENIDLYQKETEQIRNMINLYESSDLRIQQSLGGNTYENSALEERQYTDQSEVNVTNTFTSAEMTFTRQQGDTLELENETRITDRLTQNVYQAYQQNLARHQKYMQNLKQILQQNPPEDSFGSARERTMEEARLALTHPEEVVARFEDEREREVQRLETIRRETEKILSPEQRLAHSLIREYLTAPQNFYHSEMISKDNLGILLRDIRQAEQEELQSAEREKRPAEAAFDEPSGERSQNPEPFGSGEGREPVYVGGDTGSLFFEPALRREYQEAVLQTLYPVFSTRLIHLTPQITVEEVAGEVKKLTGEALPREEGEKEAALQDNLETVIERGSRITREFTSEVKEYASGEERNLIHRRQTEIINNITDRVIYSWLERQVYRPREKETYENTRISMVHRSKETSVDEETIESLRQEMQRLEETNRITTQKVENRETKETTVIQNTTRETVEDNTEQIQSIINRSVRQQLDAITERVYGRIEKQLRNEQRRRGL